MNIYVPIHCLLLTHMIINYTLTVLFLVGVLIKLSPHLRAREIHIVDEGNHDIIEGNEDIWPLHGDTRQ